MVRIPLSARRRPAAALALAVAAAAFLLHLGLGPADTFWTIDNGGKAAVVDRILATPGDAALAYPAAAWDPGYRWFPQPLRGSEPYATLRDGRVLSQYASPFTWLAAPGAAWLGFAGLGLLPALGAGAAVWLTARLAARRGQTRHPVLAAAVFALASPWLFYGSVVWEHTLVVALAAGGFLALVRPGARGALAAGVLFGAAGFLREEAFLLLPAAAMALFATGRRRDVLPLLAGGAAGLAATLAFQLATTGTWTGVHVAVNRPVPAVHAPRALTGLLLNAGGWPFWTTLLALGALAASRGVAERRGGPAPWVGVLRAAGLAGLAGISLRALAVYPAGGDDAALALLGANSAAVFLPWALALFVIPPHPDPATGSRDSDRQDPVFLTALLFGGLFVLLVPERSITGVHPAPRMLLPVLPVAAVLALERFPRGPLVGLAMLLALFAGALWGGKSLLLLHAKRTQAGAIAEAIREDPRRSVVTDLFWLPTELSALWGEKEFHLITGPEDLRELSAAAAAAGVRELLLVTAPGRVASSGPGTPAPPRAATSPRFPEFSVELHPQRLAPPAATTEARP